jgi:hypothetical protein
MNSSTSPAQENLPMGMEEPDGQYVVCVCRQSFEFGHSPRNLFKSPSLNAELKLRCRDSYPKSWVGSHTRQDAQNRFEVLESLLCNSSRNSLQNTV